MPGSFYTRTKNDSTKINSLEELLIALEKEDPDKKVWLNMELKEPWDDLKTETYDLLKKYDRAENVIWGNFVRLENNKLKVLGPEVTNFAHPNNFAFLYLLYFSGLLPFVEI